MNLSEAMEMVIKEEKEFSAPRTKGAEDKKAQGTQRGKKTFIF